MDNFLIALEDLTDRVIAERIRINRGYIVVGRLSDKLSKAAGVLGRITAKAEARADSVIEREAIIEKRIEEAFSPHEALLTDTEKGLDDVERQLALVSNGAPLPESSDTTKLDNKSTPHPGLTRG